MTDMVESLRNVALAGHTGSGKTSLAEAILFNLGTTTRLGRVEDGNTVMDFGETGADTGLSLQFFRFKKLHGRLLDQRIISLQVLIEPAKSMHA